MREYLLHMEESFVVDRTPEDCFRYITDFSTLSEWDPTITRSSKRSSGPVGLSSVFDVSLKFGIRNVDMEYSITEYEECRRAVLVGEAEMLTAVDTVDIEVMAAGGTKVTWKADITFRGWIARFLPLMENRIVQGGMETIRQLKIALEDRFPAPAPKRSIKMADGLILPGLLKFTRFGYNNASKNWKPVSAFMRGKHVLITGATSGIGLAAAHSLAAKGAKLTLVGRDHDKTMRACESIISESGNPNIAAEIADLSLVGDTKALCRRLIDKDEVIDVLINNAGALFNERIVTSEGFEKSFVLLLLSPYLLTEKLLPLISRSSDGRVVNVASGGMYSKKLEVEDLQSTNGKYNGSMAYALAKRALVIMTEEWAEKHAGSGVAFNSMHPGWADTPGVSSALPQFYRLTKRVLRTPEEGADTIVWLATASEAGNISGKFFLDREIHTTHLLPGTRESKEDRQVLKEILSRYATEKSARKVEKVV